MDKTRGYQASIDYLMPIVKNPVMTGEYCRHLRNSIDAMIKFERMQFEIERLNKLIDNLVLDLQMVATDESTEGYPCICSICESACKCPDEKRDPYSNKDSLCEFVWRGLNEKSKP